MTTNCNSCDAHAEHAVQSIIEMANCEENDFDTAEEVFQYLGGYLSKLADENEELELN